MIVCQCYGVSDRTIRKAGREGAQTAGEVGRACHAGKMCGGCTPAIDEIPTIVPSGVERETGRIALFAPQFLDVATVDSKG